MSLRNHLSLFATALFFTPVSLHAALIATDAAVPEQMERGGTAEDYARYIIGETPGYAKSMEYAWVGAFSSYNELVIQSGASLATGSVDIGYQTHTRHNRAIITGAGSRWSVDGALYVGFRGSYNSLEVREGGTLSLTNNLEIGYVNGSNYNSIVVSGPGSSVEAGSLSMGENGVGNTMTVTNGASLTLSRFSRTSIGYGEGAADNQLILDGAGTILRTGWLAVGDGEVGNTLTITNAALAVTWMGVSADAESNSVIRLNGGFLAITYDQTDMIHDLIAEGALHYWDSASGEWRAGGEEHFQVEFFGYDADDEAAAEALTGHSGLAGHTIVTSIPEPTVSTLVAGMLLFPLFRRRRA